MEGFEEFLEDNFKEVTDTLTKAITRASWDSCWNKAVEDFRKGKEDQLYGSEVYIERN